MLVCDLTGSSVHVSDERVTYVPFEFSVFPDKQPNFVFSDPGKDENPNETIHLIGHAHNAQGILGTAVAINALRSTRPNPIEWWIPYLSGARMDRRMKRGWPSTLRVVADLINTITASANVRRVNVLDVHSDAAFTEIRNSFPAEPAILRAFAVNDVERELGGPAAIVAPDAGAEARALDPFEPEIVLSKTRKKRGVSASIADGDPSGRHCLIVDDIIDGGATFAEAARVLREHGAASVSLCVTHAIFSAGPGVAGVDRFYFTDSIPGYRSRWPRGAEVVGCSDVSTIGGKQFHELRGYMLREAIANEECRENV